MGYHVIDPDDLDPVPGRPSEMRSVSDAAGMDEIGLRVYRVLPGEEIPVSGLHYHDQQEEAFYVVSGRLRVETPETEYAIEQGQFFVAEPESPHRAYSPDANENETVVIGMGAPPVDDSHSCD